MKRISQSGILIGLLALALPRAAHSQFLVGYPGPTGTDNTVAVYNVVTGQPLSITSPFNGGTYINFPATNFLSTSTGAQHFLVNETTPAPGFPNNAVEVLGVNYVSRLSAFGNFAGKVNAATLAPDDTKLLIAENTLHVFDLASNPNGPYQDLTGSGLTLPNAITVTDVVVDYDSVHAYTLSAGVTNSYLNVVNLPNFNFNSLNAPTLASQTLTLPPGATSLSIGPNGLLYVTSPGLITEVDPTPLAATPEGTVSVPINPGKPVFTPGITTSTLYLIAADPAPASDGSAAVLVNISAHTLSGTIPFNGLGGPISQINPISDLVAYALVPATTTLYQLQIGTNGGMVANVPPFAAALTDAGGSVNTTGAFIPSPGYGPPGRNAPQFLFTFDTNSGGIYEVDPVTNTVLTQFVATVDQPGALNYFIPSNPSASPQTILQFGDNQTIPLLGTTQPLVVRLLDANGLPIAGTSVAVELNYTGTMFAPLCEGQLSPQTPGLPCYYSAITTGADGYAEAVVTDNTNAVGTIQVIGSPNPGFTVTVGTPTPATPATLSVVSGQGQVVYQNPNPAPDPYNYGQWIVPPYVALPQSLVVKATDSAGNPLAGASIVFAVQSGLAGTPGYTSSPVLTASDGTASVPFNYNCAVNVPALQVAPCLAPPFATGSTNFAGEIITASSGSGASVNFYLTSVLVGAVTTCPTPTCPPNPTTVTNVPLYNVQVTTPALNSTISGVENSVIPNAIQVKVSSAGYGLPIPNVALSVGVPGGSSTTTNAACVDPTGQGIVLTDATGTATCNLQLNSVPGTAPLNIYVSQQPGIPGVPTGVPNFATVNISLPTAGSITIVSGNNQIGNSGQTLAVGANSGSINGPLTVQVLDGNGNPVGSAPVTWTVTKGSATLSNVSATTDSTGNASATVVLGNVAGVVTITATSGAATATFTIYEGPGAGNVIATGGDLQQAQQSTQFSQPLSVTVLDIDGNLAPYQAVNFTAPNGIGYVTLSGTGVDGTTETVGNGGTITILTDANGIASVTATSGPITGTQIVSVASADGAASTTFTLTVLSPGPSSLVVVNAASFTSSLSPGVLISITGTNLTPTIDGIITDPDQIADAGFTLLVDGIAAPILALINQDGLQQINAQIPYEAATGTVSITLTTPDGTGSTSTSTTGGSPVNLVTLSPAIFTSGYVFVNGSSFPEVVAQHTDGSYITPDSPAVPGETITFYATGLGQTTPTTVFTGTPGLPGQNIALPVYVSINNYGTTVTNAVYTPGVQGVYSISAQVPSSLAASPGVPLTLFTTDSTGTPYFAPAVYLPVK